MTTALYSKICEQLSTAVVHGEYFSQLKHHFRRDIVSNRIQDKIFSIRGLLKILERRDILDEENIQPLWHIATTCNMSEVITLLNEYEKNRRLPRNYDYFVDSSKYIYVVQFYFALHELLKPNMKWL